MRGRQSDQTLTSVFTGDDTGLQPCKAALWRFQCQLRDTTDSPGSPSLPESECQMTWINRGIRCCALGCVTPYSRWGWRWKKQKSPKAEEFPLLLLLHSSFQIIVCTVYTTYYAKLCSECWLISIASDNTISQSFHWNNVKRLYFSI